LEEKVADIDLNFIARQMERLITEVAAMRDDARVHGAILLRIDNTVARHQAMFGEILDELRAVHMQITRMNDRVRKLEDAAP
jgi:hypothetical protein